MFGDDKMKQMKDSGIEWIGEIPEDWDITTYRRLLNRRKEYDDQDKQVLSLTIQGVKVKNENYGKMAEDFTGHQIVKQGDLVFTPRDFDATPILSGIAPCDGCISNLYFVLYPHNISETFIPFINYFMWGVKWGGDIWKRLSYGMRFSYNFQQFGALPIAVPPIDTQRRIADFLDDKCGKIDRYIEKQQKIIDKLKEYKQAVITEAVTKGLDPDAPMKDSGIEWIGMIPEHWKVMRIKNLLKERNERSEDGIEEPLSMSQKLGLIPTKFMDTIPNIASSFIGAKLAYVNDLVFNKLKAHLGVFSVSHYDGLVSPDYAVYYSTGLANLKYLEYTFKTPQCICEFRKKSSGIADGLTRLYTSGLFSIYVPFPCIMEQNCIAKHLETKCSEIDSAISKQTSIIEKLTEYKKSLIYEAVTGKLEV